MRRYRYLGSDDLVEHARKGGGKPIASPDDLLAWLALPDREVDAEGRICATFVVDPQGCLRFGHRRSEHVRCAAGGEVLSAGEMLFAIELGRPLLVEVSNYSTGYCPEPESWPAVAAALESAGIEPPRPGAFTEVVVFRRCPECGQHNRVKDGWFGCMACGAELPAAWNLD